VSGASTRVAGRRQWALPKEADPNAPLLEVEGLTTHFSLPSATVHAVDDVTGASPEPTTRTSPGKTSTTSTLEVSK
jgi:hypothetical protein